MSVITKDSYPGLFVPSEDDVIEGASCTWCEAQIGDDCSSRDRKVGRAHAARWYDFWNATHDRREQHPVALAPWLR